MQSVFAIVIVSAVILIIALVSLMTIHSRRIKIRQQEVNEQLKRAVEAEKAANDAKTRFISTMSHDMRTPLNAIIGVVTLTSRHINNPKYVKESLDKVSVASKHLLTLVNDILDLSRIESGKLVLNPVEFMLPQMIVNLQNIIKPQIRAKQQVLNMNIHDITHERLFADELRIKQVYMNILTNAVKYTPEGGRIDFELWEKVNVVRTGWIKLFCRVSDNGIGMSNEYMKEMYDMFSRAEDSRISKIQGSGLGLPICKNLVDLMGGTIECESTLGKGTIFKISLDLECFLDDECMLPDDIRYEYGTGNMDLSYINILVAESSNSMWDIIFEMLNHHGVHADRALDGIDCIQKLAASEKGYYSLVIMDTDLDTLDGCRTTKELRKSASEYINSIPVVGIADKTNYMNIIDCMDSGMSSYVEKPVDINNLYREILRFIKRA